MNHVTNDTVILAAANITDFFRKLFGEPTYTNKDAYLAEHEPDNIIVHGGTGIGEDGKPYNHVGISYGNNEKMSNGITSLIWVLNRKSWADPSPKINSPPLSHSSFIRISR